MGCVCVAVKPGSPPSRSRWTGDSLCAHKCWVCGGYYALVRHAWMGHVCLNALVSPQERKRSRAYRSDKEAGIGAAQVMGYVGPPRTRGPRARGSAGVGVPRGLIASGHTGEAHATANTGLLALARVRGGSTELADRVRSRRASTHLRVAYSQEGVEAGTQEDLKGSIDRPRCGVGRSDATQNACWRGYNPLLDLPSVGGLETVVV